MEPVLAVSFSAGHAFAAVRCWHGTEDCIVPVETTAVGTRIAFGEAVDLAQGFWDAWHEDHTIEVVDVQAARAAFITPAPM
jgi:hypothetical protein